MVALFLPRWKGGMEDFELPMLRMTDNAVEDSLSD